ncbi:hypothetical protein VTK26DRAFT_896 [Humicola hyalothermophila]
MRKRACDSCYQRKIQCDNATPSCDWCRHHDLPCTFNRPISTRKRGKAKKTLANEAAAAERAEKRVVSPVQESPRPPVAVTLDQAHTDTQVLVWPVSLTPSSATDTPVYDTPDSSLAASSGYPLSDRFTESPARPESPAPSTFFGPDFGKLHFAGRHLGDISLQNGIPFLSAEGQRWIASRTGESAPFQALCASAPSSRARHGTHPAFFCSSMMHPSMVMDLPPRKVAEEALAMYRANPFKRTWPAVDAVLFEHTIGLAYDERAGRCSLESTASRACIFSFLALLALHHIYPPSMPSLDSEECAVQAQYLLPQVLHETTLEALQTCFLLSLYHLILGQLHKAAVYHAIACRMMFTLGANSIVVPRLSPGEAPDRAWRVKNLLRNLFWLIYCNDKSISVRTGQPPSLNDDDCDLTLPHGYLDSKYIDAIPDLDPSLLDDTATPLLPGDVRLDMIKSKTYTLLYSARAQRKSDAELIRDIRQLDDELEAWRLSVPPGFRPSISRREGQARSLPEPRKMEHAMIHMEYHHLVATIHAATGRCRSWTNHQSFEMGGVSSSLALAVEASRSTMFYVKAVAHNLMGEVFWMAVFYPISALWIIFCNIIYNPLHSHADEDLELLSLAPQLIREMRLRRLARDEMAQIKMVDEFVSELARLAGRAVLKARQERNAGL